MKKVLVANRGEIALRIMSSLKEMGIKTVAVYSEADRNAPHVRFADEAFLLGPPPSSQSYLLGDKIIETAKACGAEGIHPGYGFLSENAGFARAVTKADITFIGPSPEAMEVMGSKLAAKNAVKDYDVPLVPGTDVPVTSAEEGIKIAKEIGFPILIKASAGGGGKGMRTVDNEGELEEKMNLAISEAESSFGDGAVFIEKYIESSKHIEVQILGDTHGNIIHLFERECSVQRRHQKVIEEAPSAVIDAGTRAELGSAAVNVAKACNYVGAGTVEFLYDNGDFYFLEMNTRLQVEHPVTEMITGVDLVKEQIRIARGEAISFKQEDLEINGHALELRVYAEDPRNNFLPDIGRLELYRPPQLPGVRVDHGLEEGMQIPIHYDPMVSKLIVHAEDREQAIGRMINAIDNYQIKGFANTLSFGKYVFQHDAFRDGSFDTKFVDKYFTPESLDVGNEDEEIIAAFVAAAVFSKKKSNGAVSNYGNVSGSAWKKNREKKR